MEDQIQKLQEAIEAKFKSMVIPADRTADIEALKGQYDALKAETASKTDIEGLKDILAKQGEIINKLNEKPAEPQGQKSVKEQVEAAIKENAEGFKAFVGKSSPFKFEVKAGTMTIGGNVTGSTTLLPTPSMISGYNPYRWNPATFWDYAQVQSTGSAIISYVDEVSPDGTPATVTEGSDKLPIDVDYQVSTSSAVKVAASLKISDEMLDDISFMAEAVNNNLTNRVRLSVSGNINTYINALANRLTAVDASLAGMGGSAPTMWQLIVAAQQTLAKNLHNCTHVFLNPTDYARLLMTKGDDNIAVHLSPTAVNINGITVVSSNAVTVDKYLACDINKLNVYQYKGLTVEMGWENDDFTKNLRTFVGETRVHYFVKLNDHKAFLTGDVTDDLTTLTV